MTKTKTRGKNNREICGTCKHYDSDICYCTALSESEMYEEDSCDNWEGEN